ncbi:MAG: S-adenosylmethionine:tRNA ribosyltransferase-isomerase, partial [Lachnospiraceae bacterium]|nr:S-adenosylmethionine:tRNA ribosyltransferase-isomerase [Lachnospiraceae bacterium]
MKTSDFYYDLPAELIAQDPLEERTSSRLFVLNRGDGSFTHDSFSNIGNYLEAGDCLVLNNTKVIPARLLGVKEDTGAAVEILLLKRAEENTVNPANHADEEQTVTTDSAGVADTDRFRKNLRNNCTWECLVRPGKKLRKGARIVFGKLPLEEAANTNQNLPPRGAQGPGDLGSAPTGVERRQVAPKGSDEGFLLTAEITDILPDGNRLVRFTYDGIWEEVLDALGEMPLPPYITHKLKDKNRYQTVYARIEGSAAAPTAGLHFTNELLESLQEKGIRIAYV